MSHLSDSVYTDSEVLLGQKIYYRQAASCRICLRAFKRRTTRQSRAARSRPAFLLLMVMLVIAMASLAMLNFSRAMLISNETSQISSGRLQARMCAESGVQAVRMFLAMGSAERIAMGGTWINPNFQSRNVIPHVWPQRRGNYTIISPALDEYGNYSGIRFGLQNESAKLNLNMLMRLDLMASTGALSPAPTQEGESGGETDAQDTGSGESEPMFSPLTSEDGSDAAVNMLVALPGMTPDVAHAVLDWMDKNDTPRDFGAESETYTRMQPPYQATNGSIDSIEQLLLVRGVTPQLLYGYDENRNGLLDAPEMQKMNMGMPPGTMPGQINTAALDPNYVPPPPLGLASYFTLHSRERNTAQDGTPRVYINKDDIESLYAELKSALGNEDWASFIIAYRYGGKPANSLANPLNAFANLTAGLEVGGGVADDIDNLTGQIGELGQAAAPPVPWSAAMVEQLDLTAQGTVQFQQILDIFDATVTLGEGDQARTYLSPFTSNPSDLAETTPIVLDRLTTINASAIPGRLNIMECPRDILLTIPGVTSDIADQIVAARMDGSQSETRRFETWLAIEGIVSLDQLRGMSPVITCGGDVYKAQVIGYLEGEATFSRVEVCVDAAGARPEIKFYRRLEHLGRGFSIPTLGQRPDATFGSAAWSP